MPFFVGTGVVWASPRCADGPPLPGAGPRSRARRGWGLLRWCRPGAPQSPPGFSCQVTRRYLYCRCTSAAGVAASMASAITATAACHLTALLPLLLLLHFASGLRNLSDLGSCGSLESCPYFWLRRSFPLASAGVSLSRVPVAAPGGWVVVVVEEEEDVGAACRSLPP